MKTFSYFIRNTVFRILEQRFLIFENELILQSSWTKIKKKKPQIAVLSPLCSLPFILDAKNQFLFLLPFFHQFPFNVRSHFCMCMRVCVCVWVWKCCVELFYFHFSILFRLHNFCFDEDDVKSRFFLFVGDFRYV